MSARDVAVVAVLVFALGVAFFAANFAINTAVDALVVAPHFNESSDALNALNKTAELANKMDYVLAGFLFALALGVFITGWFIGGNAIFMVIYFLIVIVSVLISGILSSFWSSLSTASVFGTTISNFPITNHIIGNLQVYVCVIGMIGIIVMFAKPYFNQEGGM